MSLEEYNKKYGQKPNRYVSQEALDEIVEMTRNADPEISREMTEILKREIEQEET